MARSHALDDLRNTLMQAAVSAPATGEAYIEINSRVRRWVLDVASSMNPIYLAVNEHDMDLKESTIPEAIEAGLATLTDGVSFSALEKVERHIALLRARMTDAASDEHVAEYSPVFAASRAAIQAVGAALRLIDNHDIFSVVSRATSVIEECVLANAYLSLSKDYDGTLAPTNKQVLSAIEDARAEMIPLYKSGLESRLKDNVPGDFDRQPATALTI